MSTRQIDYFSQRVAGHISRGVFAERQEKVRALRYSEMHPVKIDKAFLEGQSFLKKSIYYGNAHEVLHAGESRV
jgi:hypothetical protein